MFNNKIIPIFLLVLILQGCKDVEVIVEGNGRVYDVVGEENINCGSGAGEDKCKNSYGTGVESVTFKAEPDSGYRLKTWGNSCKGDVCSSTFLEDIPELLKVAFEKVPTEISYTYNASGQRVSKTVEGEITFFIYQLDGSLLAELDANGNTLVDYIYLEGKPIAQVRPLSSGADDTAYIHADHIGAPKAATNQTGAVIWQIKTTPFGEVYSETGTLAQNQRFPGQYADQESSYSYNYFRDYDPSIGRYIQSDPIGLRGGLNTYVYVGGDPVNNIDPFGLATITFGGQGTGAGTVYNQSVTVTSNSGVALGTFDGSSTPNPYKPSNPSLTGTDAYPYVAPGSYPAANGPHQGQPAIVLNNNAAVPSTELNPNYPSQGATATYVHVHAGQNANWKGSAACPTINPSQWDEFINAIPSEAHTVVIP